MKVPALIISAAVVMLAAASVYAIDNNSTAMQRMNLMPLAFTQNNGQWPDSVQYRAGAHGATMWFTDGGVYYQFTRRVPRTNSAEQLFPPQTAEYPGSDQDIVGASGCSPIVEDRFAGIHDSLESMMIKASFVGANPNPGMRGESPMEYRCNYFLGNDSARWRTDVPNYKAVVFEEIYAGIDLKYYGDGRKMEYDFIVSPGADPNQICVKYDGAKSLAVNVAGELVVETDWGKVTELAPIVYQIENGERRLLQGTYQLASNDMFSFQLSDDYNPELAVVIDPALVYSTYLGGESEEVCSDIAVDGSGNVYVTGYTESTNFPTLNPYQSDQDSTDVFVTKLSSAGNSPVYSTYIGGGGWDAGRGIAVDGSGNAYVTGETQSFNFPNLNPYQMDQDSLDAFVAKLSSAGNSLIYSTYLGGGGTDWGTGIAVDGGGNAYVTGGTRSSNFPTQNPYQTDQDSLDAFVTKLSSAGNSLIYSTYLGGGGTDWGRSIAVDGDSNAYMTGETYSSDFPLQNPYQADQGSLDVFVTKLSSAGSSLIYSTYLGGFVEE